MPKQIFQRPAPVKRQNLNNNGRPGGAPDYGRKPPVAPKAAKPPVENKIEDTKE